MSVLLAIAVGLALIIGAFFALVAAIGVVRLPDVLLRMHASTKAGTLGVGLIAVAAALHFADVSSAAFAGLTVIFLVVTLPVSAHAIGRAAYRTGVPLWRETSSRTKDGPCRDGE